MRGIFLDLLAQPADMHVHDAQISLMLSRRSLTYFASQNSMVSAEINGENVSLSAPDGAEIPQIVYDLADKEYYNMIG